VQSPTGYIRRQKWTHPAVGSTTAVHAAINSAAVVTTGITNPDFPRVLTVVGAGSGHSAAGTVTINGTDIRDNVIADTLTLNGNTTVVGVKAFKTVTSLDFTAVTGNDANNTVAVGTGAPLGLDRLMDADEYINGSVDGVYESTRATITVDATDISKNTVQFNTALANTKTFRAVYVTKELTAASGTTS
jgi:hypothetical protein